MHFSLSRHVLVPAAVLLVLACGGGETKQADTAATSTPAVQPAAGGPLTPAPGKKTITIEMTTDDQGVNKFTPNEITAEKGDVLHFTLVTGVHNVNFLPDSNKTITPPPPSALLQVPGQTFDLAVDWPAGRYYFQCDPHALLGMVGHLTVK